VDTTQANKSQWALFFGEQSALFQEYNTECYRKIQTAVNVHRVRREQFVVPGIEHSQTLQVKNRVLWCSKNIEVLHQPENIISL